MDVLTKSTEASDWRLKGEGNANIILSYEGSAAELKGFVLRVRKLWVEKKAEKMSEEDVMKDHLEEVIWQGVLKQTGGRAEHDLEFVSQYIAPIMGTNSVYPGVPVQAPMGAAKFLRQMGVISNIDQDLPALLLPDHTTFTSREVAKGWKRVGMPVCVELKPKCGFLPSKCPYLDPKNDIKRRVPRFAMHQVLKATEIDKRHELSQYDPIDLFSGDTKRMQRTLMALLDAPNNNLRFFIGEELAFGAVHVGEERATRARLVEKLKEAICEVSGGGGQEKESNGAEFTLDPQNKKTLDSIVMKMVAKVLQKEGVMHRLLDLQKMDRLDIEAIKLLYEKLVSEYEAGTLKESDAPPGTVQMVGKLPTDTPLEQWPQDRMTAAIRGYLAAATAKDCGLMVTIQRVVREASNDCKEGPIEPWQPGQAKIMTLDEEAGCKQKTSSFMYKVAFVDLEVKLASKIPKHYALDQRVVKCAHAHPDLLEQIGYRIDTGKIEAGKMGKDNEEEAQQLM